MNKTLAQLEAEVEQLLEEAKTVDEQENARYGRVGLALKSAQTRPHAQWEWRFAFDGAISGSYNPTRRVIRHWGSRPGRQRHFLDIFAR